MGDEILTIEEVAKYLRVSDRTVYDWAQKGEIPAGKIGTVWRFKKSEVERWVNEKLSSTSNVEKKDNNSSPIDLYVEKKDEEINIKNILAPNRVVFINQITKHDALIELCSVLNTAPQIKDQVELEKSILKREELMSTSIGRGIAIPHVRLNSVTDLVCAIGVCKTPIEDFQSFDDIPVSLLVMIAASYNQHPYYLKTLSYFTSKFKSKEFLDSVKNAGNEREIYNLFIK